MSRAERTGAEDASRRIAEQARAADTTGNARDEALQNGLVSALTDHRAEQQRRQELSHPQRRLEERARAELSTPAEDFSPDEYTHPDGNHPDLRTDHGL
ncbi:hypothetical protein ACFWBG_24855 [Nocardia salmonicida]|uniref:hypothetical protein n=1 Tax=Nocardia salmonicida TaxID=53431 RepID=UPI00366EBEE9